MQMHQVRYFLALCEERNFTRAAKSCGVSQPSLTNAIKQLELELGGPLFLRERGGIQLNELGQRLQPNLKRIDQCAREAKRKATEFYSPNPEIIFQSKTMEARMRSYHIVAIAVLLVVGWSVKVLFSSPVAEAQLQATTMDVLQMHRDYPNMKDVSVQAIKADLM
jgi:Transcriptional regulator